MESAVDRPQIMWINSKHHATDHPSNVARYYCPRKLNNLVASYVNPTQYYLKHHYCKALGKSLRFPKRSMWQEDRRITHCQVCLARLSWSGTFSSWDDAAVHWGRVPCYRCNHLGGDPAMTTLVSSQRYLMTMFLVWWLVSYSSHPSNKLSYVAWIY